MISGGVLQESWPILKVYSILRDSPALEQLKYSSRIAVSVDINVSLTTFSNGSPACQAAALGSHPRHVIGN